MQFFAQDLCLRREKNGAVFCLHVPELDLQSGDIVAVFGQSGCGKSTLLDILALILRPQEGELKIRRRGVEQPKQQGEAPKRVVIESDLITASPASLAGIRSKDLGYVLQAGGLLPFLSVKENILLPAKLLGLKEKLVLERFTDLVETLGIANQIEKKPQHLSGGQRQRVAIARALIHSPSFVLADEPTAAVDIDTAENICKIFREVVTQSGAAAIIVSHDRELMMKHVDAYAEFEVKSRGENEVHSTLIWPQRV